MSELRRLREESSSPLVQNLLDSARTDRSDAGARDRAIHAVTGALAGAAVAGAASTAHAATGAVGVTAAGTSTATGSIAPAAAKGGSLILLKWLGAVAVSATVAGSAVHVARNHRLETTPPAPAASSPTLPVQAPRAPTEAEAIRVSPPAEPEPTSVEVESPKEIPTRRTPPAIKAAPVPTSTPTARANDAPSTAPSSVSEQVAELSNVRAALDGHDPARALTLIDAFDRAHPSSQLQAEATILRIDALVDAHQTAAARTLANAFLRDHPGSAYREHVRNKVDLGDQTGTTGH